MNYSSIRKRRVSTIPELSRSMSCLRRISTRGKREEQDATITAKLAIHVSSVNILTSINYVSLPLAVFLLRIRLI
ncbi:hypothetical protein D3C77_232080 [compost metagenome]